NRPHQKSRCRLITATHQYDAVDWLAAQQLFRLHSQKIPVHHRARLHKCFVDGHGRKFNRETARLPHTALHFLSPRAKVTVTSGQVTPRIDDADDWLAFEILARVTHLFGPRAMSERP